VQAFVYSILSAICLDKIKYLAYFLDILSMDFMSMRFLKSLMKKDKALVQDLLYSFDELLQRRDKRKSHVRFARPTQHGWSFFMGKNISWNLLDDIMHQTVKKHPHCHRARIADALSHISNLSDKEFYELRMLL